MSIALRGALFVVLCACVAAIMLRRTSVSSFDPAVTGSVSSEKGEVQALDALRKAGNDVTKPTEVTYYLYFPSGEAAQRAADSAKTSHFSADVLSSRGGGEWACIASAKMIPERSAMLETTKRFKAIAASLGGRYDHWEAEIAQ
jgi:hypothetical protein